MFLLKKGYACEKDRFIFNFSTIFIIFLILIIHNEYSPSFDIC